MTVSAAQLGLKDDWLDPRKKEAIRTFGSYAEAINAAASDKGNELVVEFKGDDGQIQYAVVDLAPSLSRKSLHDSANYSFPKEVLGAFLSEDDDGSNKTVEQLTSIQTGPLSVEEEADSALRLARSLVEDVNPSDSRSYWKAEGLQRNRGASTSNSRYETSYLTILSRVDGAIKKLDDELAAARTTGDMAKVKRLEAKKEELVTHQKITRAHLLIMPMSTTVIPGLEIDGKPATVGRLRRYDGDRAKIVETLSRRKGELEGQLQQLADTAENKPLREQLSRQLQDLSFALHDLEREGLQIVDAGFRIRSRIVALGDMQMALESRKSELVGLTKEIEARKADLAKLKGVSSAVPGSEGVAKWQVLEEEEIAGLEKRVSQVRDALVRELNAAIGQYEVNASGQGVSKDAIAFLRSQVEELENADGAKATLDAINKTQSELAKKVEEGAAIWDGISPKEGKMLVGIGQGVDEFREIYAQAKKDLKALSEDAKEIRRISMYSYAGAFAKGFFDKTEAVENWDPRTNKNSGVRANEIISETYHFLDGQMASYLNPPGDPPLPKLSNWLTFAKYASSEAGRQITNLEASLSALYTLKTFDGYATNDKDAIKALVKLMREDDMLEQSMRLGLHVAKNTKVDWETMLLGLLSPTGGLTAQGAKTVSNLIDTIQAMRNSLVGGNAIIFKNAGPTYDIFLKAEARGEDGLQALVAAGYAKKGGGTAEDPNGLVYEAFVAFKRARLLGIEAAKEKDPTKRAELLAKRERATEQANFNFVSHEQWDLAETDKVFRRPRVAEATAQMAEFMYVHDARGKHKILPNGGNWADFKTREGLKEISKADYDKRKAEQAKGTANASGDPIVIAVKEGKTVHYYETDPSKLGTIYTYFRGGLKAGEEMTATPPETFKPKYTHVVPTTTDRLEEVVGAADTVLTYTNPVYGGIKLAKYLF